MASPGRAASHSALKSNNQNLWSCGERVLLLLLHSRVPAECEDPWSMISSDMTKLSSKLTKCNLQDESLCTYGDDQPLFKYSAMSCEAEFTQMISEDSTEGVLKKLVKDRISVLRENLRSLKERYRNLHKLTQASEFDQSDPFTQEMLNRFAMSSCPVVAIKADNLPTEAKIAYQSPPQSLALTASTTRGRKRTRLGSSTESVKQEVINPVSEQGSPSRALSRSLSNKRSVGSPSPAISGRTRSSANFNSSPSTPITANQPIHEDEKETHRGRSGSRTHLPPLVIRIPTQAAQQHSVVPEAVSPKSTVSTTPVTAALSPSLAKSPITRMQQQKAAISLECPTSPTPSGSRPHTPVASSPSFAPATTVTQARRSPRVASTSLSSPTVAVAQIPPHSTGVAKVASSTVENESPVTPSRKIREFSPQPQPHRSRSKSDASSTATVEPSSSAVVEETNSSSAALGTDSTSAIKPVANTTEQQTDDRPARMARRLLMQMWRAVGAHRHSPIFANPVTEDIAPNYSQIVYKPKDLSTIRQHIESGRITSVAELQLELMIMFQNALMYNGREHTVHQMAADMYNDVMQHFEAYSSSTPDRGATTTGPAASVASKKSSRSRRRHSEVESHKSTSVSEKIPPTVSENGSANLAGFDVTACQTVVNASTDVISSTVSEDANMEIAERSPKSSDSSLLSLQPQPLK